MSALDTSQTTNTTLPQWFTNSQQNIAQGITGALSNITPTNQTVANGAIQSLSGPSNPFTQGTATLQDIAHGAANPWLPSGQPDTSTALGNLFSAQNTKLDQILPSVAAKEGAAGVATGNYGGLRGQTAVDTARAGALTTLAEQQDQTALNAQTQGIQAESAAGNLENQYGTTATNLGNYQQLGALPSYVQAANALANTGSRTDQNQVETKNAGLAANLTSGATTLQNLGIGAGDILSGNTGIPWLNSIINGGLPFGTGSTVPTTIYDTSNMSGTQTTNVDPYTGLPSSTPIDTNYTP